MSKPTEKDMATANKFLMDWIDATDARIDLFQKMIAQTLADQREKDAQIAELEANLHQSNNDPQRMDACRWVAKAIRQGIE